MAPVIDPVAAVTLCADVSNVDTVIVDGVVRKRDGKLVADVGRARSLVEASRDHLLRRSREGRGERGDVTPAPGPHGAARAAVRRRTGALAPDGGGLAPLVCRRTRTTAPCTPGSASASCEPGGRCRRTCTPSRRASTSLDGTVVLRHARGRVLLRAGRLRAAAGRRAARLAQRRRREPARWADMLAPAPRARLRRRHLPRCPTLPARRAGPGRRPRPAHPPLRPHRAGAHGAGQADPGPARGLGEHAHRAARLQRHHREDDGRLRPGRGRSPPCSWCSTSPTAWPAPHDHPFEETYLFLEGEVEAQLRRRRTGSARATWPGPASGCVHGFRNAGAGPVRWLETQAPQPPGRHSYRFVRDWDYLRATREL